LHRNHHEEPTTLPRKVSLNQNISHRTIPSTHLLYGRLPHQKSTHRTHQKQHHRSLTTLQEPDQRNYDQPHQVKPRRSYIIHN
jgi:hypothetical protein